MMSWPLCRGALVDYIEHSDVIHMWMVMAPEPESRQAFDAAAEFLIHLPA
jgi:hypothetical protein